MVKTKINPNNKSGTKKIKNIKSKYDARLVFLTVFSIFSGLLLSSVIVLLVVFKTTHKLDHAVYGLVSDRFCSEEGLSYHKNQILNQDKNESVSDPETTFAWLDFAICAGQEHPDEYDAALKSYFKSIDINPNLGD